MTFTSELDIVQFAIVPNRTTYSVDEPKIIVDAQATSDLAILNVSSLSNDDQLIAVPTLRALSKHFEVSFRVDETRTQEIRVGDIPAGQPLFLSLTTDGAKVPQRDLDNLETGDLTDVIDIQLMRAADGGVTPVEIVLTRCEPADGTMNPLEITAGFHSSIQFGIAEKSSRKPLKLGHLKLIQPPGQRAYAGFEKTVEMFLDLEFDQTEATAYIAANPELVTWSDGDTDLGAAPISAGTAIVFAPQRVGDFEIAIRADAFDAPEMSNVETVKLKWRVDDFRLDGSPMRHEKSHKIDVLAAQGEVVRLVHRGEAIVPNLANSGSESKSFTEAFMYDPELLDTPGSNDIRLKISRTGADASDIRWRAVIHPQSVETTLNAGEGVLFANGNPDEDTINISLDTIPGLQDFLQQGENIRIEVTLTAKVRGRDVSGICEVVARSRRDPSELVFALDFGASATAVWAGGLGEGAGIDLPLGAFSRKVFGWHREWREDGENVLLPMVVDLSSERHARSLRDPFSLGKLDIVGSEKENVGRRLALLNRTYDVSVPAISSRSQNATKGQSKSASHNTIVRDLKRSFIRSRTRRTEEVWVRRDGDLGSATLLDADALLMDVFDELGRYHVPRAMLENHHKDGEKGDETVLDKWLGAKAENFKFIITYPIGQPTERIEKYKQAGRRFAQAVAGGSEGIRDPEFVPEALAAAFSGINWDKYRNAAAQTDEVHEQLFACIDIGASTFDATLLRINLVNGRSDPDEPWEIIAHFGGAVGGEDLDEGLLAIAEKFLNRQIGVEASPYEPLVMTTAAQDPGRLRHELMEAIAQAKVRLHDALLIEKNAEGLSAYNWGKRPETRCFEIDVTRIVDLAIQYSGAVALPAFPEQENEVRIRTELVGRDRKFWLCIPRVDLIAEDQGIDEADLRDRTPRAVASLLGVAIPTLMLRECGRLGLGAPDWIISGRASLWPSIYGAMLRTITRADQGGTLDAFPASPEILKRRVIDGAHSLVLSGCKLPDKASANVGMVRLEPVQKKVNKGKYKHFLEDVDYLTYPFEQLARESGSAPFPADVMPGFAPDQQQHLLGLEEIQKLFFAFDVTFFSRRKHPVPRGAAPTAEPLPEDA